MKFTVLIPLCALLFTVPAYASTLDLDCDATADRFSELRQQTNGQGAVVSAVLTPLKRLKSSNYAPAAMISLQNIDGSGQVGLRIYETRKSGSLPLAAQIVVVMNGERKELELGPLDWNNAVPMGLRVTAADSVEVTFADMLRPVTFYVGTITFAKVACSTGEFLFKNIVLGRE